ncbi:MAG: hypothetical protein LKJ88_02515 [Bacilli bacterium]|jgi:hypothetical protein|nr:hypothetical protein [Bacilli bacterium]
MHIQWFSRAEKEAIATIYPTNITINKAGSSKLETACAALVGLVDESKLVVIKPLDRNQAEDGSIEKDMLFPLSGGKTYTRVSSTDFVSEIGQLLHYDFNKGAKKFPCYFDDDEGALIIELGKEVK